MNIRIAALLALGALVFAPRLTLADESHSLEQVMVEMAKTPAEHQALAEHYRSKAADARADAKEHETMARTYIPSGQQKMSWGTIQQRQKMADHCKKLQQQDESIAQEYDALAKLHDEEAKKAQ